MRGESTQRVLTLRSSRFGVTSDGRPVEIFTLARAGGLEVSLISYGAAIQSIWAPDQRGERANVALGFAELRAYEAVGSAYLGASVGRYANRIAEGRFRLDGQTHQLSRNEGRHHLHGGWKGFDKKVWSAKPRTSEEEVAVLFACSSESGDEGYPGALEAEVTYALNADDTLTIRYRATASDPTIVNLTNHALFNLRGAGTILDHSLELDADAYTPVTPDMIPTGDIDPVKGTPMDFRSPHRIGDRIDTTFDQLVIGGGYDHNYVLSAPVSDAPTFAARLRDGQSGRTLEVWTTEPGIQLYTGNRLDGTLTGIGDVVYERFAGVALETQHFPDSPNHLQFPSTVLRPRDLYESITELRFQTVQRT
jgi:aldose 1-epimerase